MSSHLSAVIRSVLHIGSSQRGNGQRILHAHLKRMLIGQKPGAACVGCRSLSASFPSQPPHLTLLQVAPSGPPSHALCEAGLRRVRLVPRHPGTARGGVAGLVTAPAGSGRPPRVRAWSRAGAGRPGGGPARRRVADDDSWNRASRARRKRSARPSPREEAEGGLLAWLPPKQSSNCLE